jgi:dipeptidyl aminopeptidase/acylaminoacyl peptidase
MNRHPTVATAFIVLALLCAARLEAAAAIHALTVDDLLRAESPFYPLTHGASFSPDGRALAFSVMRSKAEDPKNWLDDVDGSITHSDIWWQSASGEKSRRLTDGAHDSSGWSMPLWSPDGKQLLIASTRGGVFQLWVMDPFTGAVKVASNYPLDVEKRFSTVWVDNRRILFYSSDREVGTMFPNSIDVAQDTWSKARSGVQPTSSALAGNIGLTSSLPSPPVVLILADVAENKSLKISEGDTARFDLSPDRRYVAVVRASRSLPPKAAEKLSAVRRPTWSLEVHALGGALLYQESRPLAATSLSWTSTSGELAYWTVDGSDALPGLSVLSMASRLPQLIPLNGLAPRVDRPILWSRDGHLIVNAGVAHDDPGKQPNRFDWLTIGRDQVPRNLTARLPNPPLTLHAVRGGRAFIGIADGSLWQFDATGRQSAREVDAGIKGTVKAPDVAVVGSITDAQSWLLESERPDSSMAFYSVDASTLQATPLVLPADSEQPMELIALAYAAGSSQALIYKTHGDNVVLMRAGWQGVEVLRSMNEWGRDIAPNPTLSINYKSLEGEDLLGCVILPPDYVSGRRYPLLTWVYAGKSMDAQCTDVQDYSLAKAGVAQASLNVRLAASHGYAVLLPSMPVRLSGESDVPLSHLTNGVLPAVDKLISLGVADPERLFVAGQSFGGFSAYGLVTQTARFKAAAAFGGWSDFTSAYGSAKATSRYGEYLEELLVPMEMIEEAQASLRFPPWQVPDRYRRASPISFVENVATPVLILQGDQDMIPIEQGEEFFASLYRQGKPAEFVRYWGEGHLIMSPANARDVWNRLMAWFDNYGDVARDSNGSLIFDGNQVRSREGAPALAPDNFARFN